MLWCLSLLLSVWLGNLAENDKSTVLSISGSGGDTLCSVCPPWPLCFWYCFPAVLPEVHELHHFAPLVSFTVMFLMQPIMDQIPSWEKWWQIKCLYVGVWYFVPSLYWCIMVTFPLTLWKHKHRKEHILILVTKLLIITIVSAMLWKKPYLTEEGIF